MNNEIKEQLENHREQAVNYYQARNKYSNEQIMILTKDQDFIKNSLFDELAFQTVSSDSFDSEEYKQNQKQKQEIENDRLPILNIISNDDLDQNLQHQTIEIEQKLQLSKEHVENMVRLIDNCFSQEELSQLNISSDMASLQNNIHSLQQMIGLENLKDIEIITMLLMLLLKMILTNQYENAENLFNNYQQDQHINKLYEIYDSCPKHQSPIDQQQYQSSQIEIGEPQVIEISLEKNFKQSLLQKLD